MPESNTLNTTIYVDHGFEFPVKGGGELRVRDTSQGLYTGDLPARIEFHRIPRIDQDSSDLLRIRVRIPDNKGNVWAAEHVMHPFWLIWHQATRPYHREGNGPLANRGTAYSPPFDHFQIRPLVEQVLVTADDREDYPIWLYRREKDDQETSLYAGNLRIKYFGAELDLLAIERGRKGMPSPKTELRLRLTSHVDTELYIQQSKEKSAPTQVDLLKQGPITTRIQPGAYLLQEHFRHIHEEGGHEAGAWIPRSIPVPVTFHQTEETADPCKSFIHEPD